MASDDVRRMRQERAAQNRRKALPAKVGKRLLVGLIAAIALAGIVYAVQQNAETRASCPGHWHATFAVYVDGERVPFPQPPYLIAPQGKLPLSMHMHTPSQETLHFEPAQPECLGVKDTMEYVDVDLSESKLTLSGSHEQGTFGGTYEETGNRTLRFFVQERGGEMRETEWSDLRNRQLLDGEKLLIVYGDDSDEEVASYMEALPGPPGA
jgi:hypothetical protein